MYNQPLPPQQQIQVKINDEVMKGSYANSMMVMHTKEEFIMDFISLVGNQGIVNARVITSPGHMKRILNALKENVEKYENVFGKIVESEGPAGDIGFMAKQ